MPNILKRFLGPEATPYELPSTDELVMEPEAKPNSQGSGEEEPAEAPSSHKPPPQTPIHYAQLQAEAILDDARAQADALLEQAQADIADELDQLRAGARDEGFRSGYAEGMSHALAEAQAQRTSQAAQLGAEVRRFLEKASLAQDEMLNHTQDELRDLAIAVAEKIVRISLKSSGEILSRMIQGATEKLKRKEWVHIYIAGCDAKTMAQVTPSLTAALSVLSNHVRIIPMADDESGTCIIEMPDEIIDASAATQLSNIRDLLSDPQTRDA